MLHPILPLNLKLNIYTYICIYIYIGSATFTQGVDIKDGHNPSITYGDITYRLVPKTPSDLLGLRQDNG